MAGLSRVVAPTVCPVDGSAVKLGLRIEQDEEDDLIDALIAAATDDAENRLHRAILPQTWRLSLDRLSDRILIPWPVARSVTLEIRTEAGGTVADEAVTTVLNTWALLDHAKVGAAEFSLKTSAGASVSAAKYAVDYGAGAVRALHADAVGVGMLASYDYGWTVAANSDIALVQGPPSYLVPGYGKTWQVPIDVPDSVRVTFAAYSWASPATVPAGIRQWIVARVGELFEQREASGPVQLYSHRFVDGMLAPWIVPDYAARNGG